MEIPKYIQLGFVTVKLILKISFVHFELFKNVINNFVHNSKVAHKLFA